MAACHRAWVAQAGRVAAWRRWGGHRGQVGQGDRFRKYRMSQPSSCKPTMMESPMLIHFMLGEASFGDWYGFSGMG